MELMGPWDRDGGFYILRPHTAAFSKQSTIIRSDKRANTEHSRVKIKQPPPSLPHSPSLSSPSSSRILMLLCLLPRFHTSPGFFTSAPLPSAATSSVARGGVTVSARNERSLPAFLGQRPIRPRRRAAYYLLIKRRTQKKGLF